MLLLFFGVILLDIASTEGTSKLHHTRLPFHLEMNTCETKTTGFLVVAGEIA